jgi:hypothetical protein
MENDIFNLSYSIPIVVPINTIVRRNNRIYLGPQPYLRNVKIKAISFYGIVDAALFFYDSSYNLTFTLYDNNKEIKLLNYPLNDLSDRPTLFRNIEDVYLRKFKINGIITESSYVTWCNGSTIATSSDPFNLGFINFYA